MLLQRLALRVGLACLVLAGSAAHADTLGLVSFYGHKGGRVTANGERFNPWGDTCASWTLKFGTRVQVTDPATGRSVMCRVNDRGPHPRLHRAIDLSHGLARRLGIESRGVIRARISVLGR